MNQLLDEDGDVIRHREYDSFGNIDHVFNDLGTDVGSAGMLSDVGFAGREWDDDAQLYYNRARWYDSNTGRFIGVDPIEDGNNWYVYAGSDPVNYRDPTGLSAAHPLQSLGSAVGSVASSVGTSISQIAGGLYNLVSPTVDNIAFSFSYFQSQYDLYGPATGGAGTLNSSASTGRPPSAPPSNNFLDSFFTGDPDPIGTQLRSQAAAKNLAELNQSIARGETRLGLPQNQSDTYDPLLSFGVNAGAGFVPLVGEVQDVAVLFGSNSTTGERFLAAGSLLLNLVTLGTAPNAGGAIRGSKALVDKPPLVNNQAFRDNFDEVFGGAKKTGGVGPVNKGKIGEKLQDAKVTAEGDIILARQPTFELPSGKRSRPDKLTESATGKSRVREAKNGPTAKLTENQQELRETVQNKQPVIPRGKRVKEAGLEPGAPVILDEFIEDRFP